MQDLRLATMGSEKNQPRTWFGRTVSVDYSVPKPSDKTSSKSSNGPAPKLSDSTEPNTHPRLKFYSLGGVIFVCCLVVFWAIASTYFSKINIGGQSVMAYKSDQVLSDAISKQAKSYKLAVVYPDKTQKQYTLPQMGLKVDEAASIKLTRTAQYSPSSRLVWWRPVDVKLVIKKNKEVFARFVASKASLVAQPPRDAKLSIVNGKITITDAVVGKQYGLTDPESTILASITHLDHHPVKLGTVAINPALNAAILAPYKTDLEKTLRQKITFSIAGNYFSPSDADIANWLEITPNDKSKKVDIAVNSGKVQEYIDGIAAAYVHPARAQIESKKQDGTLRILVTGSNGTDITNKASVSKAVAADLLKANGQTHNLSVSYQPFSTITTGSYPKWIEVDLTSKRMYAYQNGVLIRTSLVSAGAPLTPTVTGQYRIYSKFAIQDMRGSNVDGSRYFQPNVRWISYFYSDYAIHGNYWRPTSYFGNINSSHGCVGLLDSEAKWVYDWAPIGTPVITHT